MLEPDPSQSRNPSENAPQKSSTYTSMKDPLKTTSNSTGSGSTRIVEECLRMLRFALDKGKNLPDPLAVKISQIDACLRGAALETIAEVPAQVFSQNASPSIPIPKDFDFTATILSVHSQLSALVAPATAQTLWATSNDRGIKLFFNLPSVIQAAMLLAISFAVMFVITVVRDGPLKNATTGSGTSASGTIQNSSSGTSSPGVPSTPR